MQTGRCFNCMNDLSQAAGSKCPVCGFDNADYRQPDHILPGGTLLHDRYYIGRMLGKGGFGITYIGYDMTLCTTVCIKEYFPSGGAMRNTRHSHLVSWEGSEHSAFFKDRREMFVNEARKAARVRDLQSIVSVWDVFDENDTAYIVMQYIKGRTLMEYLRSRQTVLSFQECMSILRPIITDLIQVHKNGLIHRDISPDNIMLKDDGKPILLDLGSAKDITLGTDQSSTLVVKHGFSPPEQYTVSERIGTWTDVYALCATIYFCITGKLVPDALDRMLQEKTPLNIPATVPEDIAETLRSGLALRIEDRIQNAQELLYRLDHAAGSGEAAPGRRPATSKETDVLRKQQTAPIHGQKKKPDERPVPGLPADRKNILYILAAVCVLVILGSAVGLILLKKPPEERPAAEQAIKTEQKEGMQNKDTQAEALQAETLQAETAANEIIPEGTVQGTGTQTDFAAVGGNQAHAIPGDDAVSPETTAETAATSYGSFQTVEKGKLHIATDPYYPPYEMITDDGSYTGIDIEIAAVIASRLELELVIDEVSFDSLLSSVQNGEADLAISALSMTEERAQMVSFTDNYASNAQIIIVGENAGIASPEDLKGKVIGCQEASAAYYYCLELNENITTFDTIISAMNALLAGEIDCIVAGREYMALAEEAGLVCIDSDFSPEYYSIAVSKENPGLLENVNRILQEMREDGTLDTILSTPW